MTRVFVAPSKTRKPFLSVLEIAFPIIAACPLPKPGRKPHNGEAIKVPSKGLKIFIFGFVIFCFISLVLFFMLKISVELPKSPVSKGKSGSLISIFKTLQPKNPESNITDKA